MTHKIPSYSIVGGRYILGQLIGKGAFGQVYLATVEGQNTLYAVKREDDSIKHPQLLVQAKILKNYDKAIGFPKVYWVGQENKSTYMVIDLLGPSLEDLFCLCNKQFTLKTVLMLADQMIARMEQFHSFNYIHRDVKPENFLMGLEDNSHLVYLVDYGLSRRFRDPKTHQHIPYKQNKNLTGTVRYSSINTHFGFEQSRRDDLQSIGFILIYFLKGSLPWQGIKANNKCQKYQKIQEKKLSTPIEMQCKDLPIQFSTYMNYCRTLKFEEKPDYRFLRKLFRDLFERIGFILDFSFDWCNLPSRKQLDTNNLTLIIEKQGDQIPALEENAVDKVKEMKEEEINLELLSSNNSRLRQTGSQNVPEQSFNETDLSLLGRRESQKDQKFKMMDVKNIDQW